MRAEHGLRRLAPRLLGASAILALAVSCALFETLPAERAGWDEEQWGPVLPHSSFPANCELCHVTNTWTEIKADFVFDHAAETGVALLGAHAQGACLRCHNDRGPVQQYAALGCRGCHVDPHEATLGDQCASCHSEQSWTPEGMTVRHLEVGFPLYGSHGAISCDQCHPNARSQDFRGAPTSCLDCHMDDRQRAVSPDHTSFVDCDRCHSVFVWEDAIFPHDTFPLVGGHATVNCAQCHPGNSFQGTPRDCAACHLDDYNRVTDPNHVTAGFSMQCETCHSVNGWTPSSFAHATWPLTGAHQATACNRCHQNGVFAGTPRNCVDCHQNDYNATTNPNHTAAGFPTTCEGCHSTASWQGAVFNHTFDIRNGAHKIFGCSDCHPNQANFSVFTCTNCHSLGKMNDVHLGKIAGYSYDNAACLSCHPTGR